MKFTRISFSSPPICTSKCNQENSSQLGLRTTARWLLGTLTSSSCLIGLVDPDWLRLHEQRGHIHTRDVLITRVRWKKRIMEGEGTICVPQSWNQILKAFAWYPYQLKRKLLRHSGLSLHSAVDIVIYQWPELYYIRKNFQFLHQKELDLLFQRT